MSLLVRLSPSAVSASAAHTAAAPQIAVPSMSRALHFDGAAPIPHIGGSLASVWLIPSGIEGAARWWEKGKGGNLSVFNSTTAWNVWQRRRDSDAALLHHSLGDHPRATAIIMFDSYLADVDYYGDEPLNRLGELVSHFASNGVRPLLFIGDAEFYGDGTWGSTHDVVRNASARQYLLGNVRRALAVPAVAASVQFASTYWLGNSNRCTGAGSLPKCTEAQITDYVREVQQTIHEAGKRHLLHVDGPFWDGCPALPGGATCNATAWNVAGYSPRSMRDAAVAGLMGESWAMGSLRRSVRALLDAKAVATEDVLLLNDVPNCDLPAANRSCSTGSLAGDDAMWFDDLSSLGLNAWGVWDFIDGGLGDSNEYGDARNDGGGLTAKGELHRAQALRDAKQARREAGSAPTVARLRL
jgi:hypothetical protein